MIRQITFRLSVTNEALRDANFPIADKVRKQVWNRLDDELATLSRLRYVDALVLKRELQAGNTCADDFLRDRTTFFGTARVLLSAKPRLKRRHRPVSCQRARRL